MKYYVVNYVVKYLVISKLSRQYVVKYLVIWKISRYVIKYHVIWKLCGQLCGQISLYLKIIVAIISLCHVGISSSSHDPSGPR